MDNFQRVGSVSNSHVGRNFEDVAIEALASSGIYVKRNYSILVGVDEVKKNHQFDLGSEEPLILVECKSHRWTTGGNTPSAKMTVWNEAMYYFSCASSKFRRILFVIKDVHPRTGESLAAYYIRTYSHLIPRGVELWEYDEATGNVEVLHGS